MQQPIVSVIMPAYNAEKYIKESILSVMQQSYADWELIVVNDGSTDETGTIVSSMIKDECRIKIVMKQNGGLSNARNTGIKQAHGEYIAFLDSDDIWLKDKLLNQMAITRRGEIDVIYSDGYIFNDEHMCKRKIAFSDCFDFVYGMQPGMYMHGLLIQQNRIPVLTAMCKKSTLFQVGLFDENLKSVEDYDLWLRLSASGATFYGLSQQLAMYRLHEDAMSRDFEKIKRSEIAVMKKSLMGSTLFYNDKHKRLESLYNELFSIVIAKGNRRSIKVTYEEIAVSGYKLDCGRFKKFVVTIMPRLYCRIHKVFVRLENIFKYRIGNLFLKGTSSY